MSQEVKTILESEIKSAFSLFDHTGNATIEYKDFGTLIRSLGFDMNQEVALAIAEKLDEQTDKGCVTYSIFKAYFYNKLNSVEMKEDFKKAFEAMDIDKDKLISFNDLKLFLQAAQEERTDEQINEMISDADIDGDGHINYEEFVRLMVTR